MPFLFGPTINLLLLALEAQQAAGLRLYRLGQGGASAWDESALMMGEKIDALGRATASLATGGTLDGVVSDYRSVVRANILRLASRPAYPA